MFWEFSLVFVIDFQFDSIIDALYMISILHLSRFVLCVCFFLFDKCSTGNWEKMYSAIVGWSVTYMLIRSCWFCHSDHLYLCDTLPNSSMSCWMEEVLTFPTMIIDFSFFFQLYQLLLRVFDALWFNFYTLVYCVSLADWSFLIHQIMSLLVSGNFLCSLLYEILIPILLFSTYQCMHLKWVSYMQHIVGFYFLIYSANLCPLIGVFSPLTFKLIIDMLAL